MTERTDLDALARRLSKPGGRRLVALVGAPGSGKSTLCGALERRLNEAAPGRAVTVPMDGFHYDDAVLCELGLLARKGAPETFDVGGLAAALARLRTAEDPWVAVPLFDRSLEIARAGARLVRPEVDVVLVEGNYLLLDEPPWDGLPPFDLAVRLDVPEVELRRRLEARWADLPPEEARRKVEENDLPNGRRARERSRPPDLTLEP